MTAPPHAPSESRAVIRFIWSRRGWLAASLLVVLSCAAWTWISFQFRYGEGHADRPILTFVLLYACAWTGFFLGALQLRRGDRRAPLLLILATALVARFLLLPSGLIQENDVYRYVLDGQVLLEGENPYEHSPLELSLLPPDSLQASPVRPGGEGGRLPHRVCRHPHPLPSCGSGGVRRRRPDRRMALDRTPVPFHPVRPGPHRADRPAAHPSGLLPILGAPVRLEPAGVERSHQFGPRGHPARLLRRASDGEPGTDVDSRRLALALARGCIHGRRSALQAVSPPPVAGRFPIRLPGFGREKGRHLRGDVSCWNCPWVPAFLSHRPGPAHRRSQELRGALADEPGRLRPAGGSAPPAPARLRPPDPGRRRGPALGPPPVPRLAGGTARGLPVGPALLVPPPARALSLVRRGSGRTVGRRRHDSR